MAEEENTKLKNVDEGLNDLILKKYDKLIDAYSTKQYVMSYNLMRSLFYMIEPYDFSNKDDLKNIFDEIENFKLGINGETGLTKASVIRIGSTDYKFSLLVDQAYRLLPQAFAKLGKWMHIIKQYDDFDEMLSIEMFNNEQSFIEKKKEDLLTLSTEELLKLFNPNHIHHAHSRFLINRGIHNVTNK